MNYSALLLFHPKLSERGGFLPVVSGGVCEYNTGVTMVVTGAKLAIQRELNLNNQVVQCRTIISLLLLTIVVACKPAEPTVPTEPPVEFTVQTQHESFAVSKYRGDVVYVDFWATWCGPCRDSFPWMAQMQEKYWEQGLRIIALSLDNNHDMALEFAGELAANFTIGFDDSGEIADLFKVKGMPTSVVLDRHGRVVKVHEGFREELQDEYEKSIVAALENP